MVARMGPVRIPAVLAALVSATTYRRGVHLLLGAVILLPYVLLGAVFTRMLTDGASPRPVTLLILVATVAISTVPAFLRGTRALEIAAARLLLDADLPEPAVGWPTRLALETRIRAALWFTVHLCAGAVVACTVQKLGRGFVTCEFVRRVDVAGGHADRHDPVPGIPDHSSGAAVDALGVAG